ncbi:probable serine/threonine-protein kinase abkC isoform X2 [Asparagus officinalis]|nr:probable serine/threonine-protein kinase abkC isoform X2 [Asparagus officinalis]
MIRHHGSLVKIGYNPSLCRIFSTFKAHDKVKENSWKRSCAKKLLGLAKNSSLTTNYAQLHWKSKDLVHSFHTATFPSMKSLEPWKGNCANISFGLSKLRYSTSFSAQVVGKRVNFLRPYYTHISPHIRRLSCALSLCLTRFHIVPGILALFVGGAASCGRTWADGEHFQSREGFYTTAQDGYDYLYSVLYSIYDGIILIFRTIYLAILFAPAIVLAPVVDTFGLQFRKTWLRLVHSTLEKAGPAFIKWGQWAATRPDLFPNDLCIELSKLHSKAPAHSFSYSKITIEKAFGRKLSEIFEHFEEMPVASGSIAQVHRASLIIRYPGQQLKKPIEVAVKVRHPGVGNSIRRDFMIINLVAKISTFIPGLNWLRLDESVRQFGVFMMSQVDLSREAANLSRFIYNFRRWKDVSFPKPLYPLVHPSVLVETFEKGDGISLYFEGLEENARIKRDIAHIGTHALLKMLLVDNFVHADMHPGNILVRAPQKKGSRKNLFRAKPQVIFLDVGMTAELSKTDQANLLDFFKAVAIRDGRTAAECTLRLSKRQSCPNPKAFIEELDKTFTFWGTPEGDIFHPAECMYQLLDTVRRYKVNVDSNVCTVMVTILVLEGWQRKLDPNYDIMHTLKTLLLKEDWAQPIDYFFS